MGDRLFPESVIRLGQNMQPLLRPITRTIEGYLKEAFELSAGSKYVFTNDGSDEVMGIRAPLAIPYNIMQYLRRKESFEIEHFSMHDLRRTCRSNLSSLTEFHVAEIMLGQTVNCMGAGLTRRRSWTTYKTKLILCWHQASKKTQKNMQFMIMRALAVTA
jgi:hypothetical protein